MTDRPAELSLESSFPGALRKAPVIEEVEQFYLDHHAALQRFLIAAGCAPDDAPDLIQEGFILLFKQLQAGARIDAPRNWLARVLPRLWFNHVRKRRREAALETSVDLQPDSIRADDSYNPERQLHLRQRSERLAAAVRRLTRTQRRYLVLRAEGMKFREIADLHGVTVATVADVCARALEKLRVATNE